MKKIILSFLAISLIGCSSLIEEFKYYADYDFQIKSASVDSEDVVLNSESKMSFSDNNFDFAFDIEKNGINLIVKNKTKQTAKLLWSSSAMVMPSGRALNIFNGSTKLIDKEKPINPSVIVPGSFINDMVFPLDYTSWVSSSRGGYWKTDELFEGMYKKAAPSALEDFKKSVSKYDNRELVTLLIAIEFEGKIKNYQFRFVSGKTQIKEITP